MAIHEHYFRNTHMCEYYVFWHIFICTWVYDSRFVCECVCVCMRIIIFMSMLSVSMPTFCGFEISINIFKKCQTILIFSFRNWSLKECIMNNSFLFVHRGLYMFLELWEVPFDFVVGTRQFASEMEMGVLRAA